MTYFLNILLAVSTASLLGLLLGGGTVFGKKPETSELTQLSFDDSEAPAEKSEKVAFIRCSGHDAELKYTYVGERDCLSASMLAGGDKACEFSCLGLGSCADVCKSGAISVKDGVCEVDEDKCGGCGACERICPRGIISLIPRGTEFKVRCANRALGSQTRRLCEVGCIGCHACEKTCNYGAIEIADSLAHIDYSKCTGCGECAPVCPRGIITAPPVQEEEEPFDESEYFELGIETGEETEEETVQQ